MSTILVVFIVTIREDFKLKVVLSEKLSMHKKVPSIRHKQIDQLKIKKVFEDKTNLKGHRVKTNLTIPKSLQEKY